MAVCKTCHGEGATQEWGAAGDWVKCPDCDGKGEIKPPYDPAKAKAARLRRKYRKLRKALLAWKAATRKPS